jgi:hypothetical protein
MYWIAGVEIILATRQAVCALKMITEHSENYK